jgi:hypothetical protein
LARPPLIVPYYSRDANPTGFRQSLQPCRYVDAIAINVIRFGDHIPEIDTNPESNPLVLTGLRVALCHPTLNLSSAAHRVDDTPELGKQAVAGVLYGTAPVLLDLRIDQLEHQTFM